MSRERVKPLTQLVKEEDELGEKLAELFLQEPDENVECNLEELQVFSRNLKSTWDKYTDVQIDLIRSLKKAGSTSEAKEHQQSRKSKRDIFKQVIETVNTVRKNAGDTVSSFDNRTDISHISRHLKQLPSATSDEKVVSFLEGSGSQRPPAQDGDQGTQSPIIQVNGEDINPGAGGTEEEHQDFANESNNNGTPPVNEISNEVTSSPVRVHTSTLNPAAGAYIPPPQQPCPPAQQ